MRVALLAEGCYPYVTGGVSTWCDQLLRGMPEHEFEVVGVCSTGREPVGLELPDNVVRLTPVALWGTARRRRGRPGSRAALLRAWRALLPAMLDPAAPPEEFTERLRALFELAQRGDLTGALQSEEAVLALARVWGALPHGVPLTMRDALDATDLVEHFLRPLSAPVVQADLCHAVSNGLPALLALGAKWRHGTPLVMSEHGVYLRERYLAFRDVRYSWPVKVVLLALFRRVCWTAYAGADLIVPVNVYNQRWEVRHGADPDAISTAYNGVSAAAYPSADAEPEVPTLGWVGRVDPLKDLETLVRAFALVRERRPDAVLRLFGPTPAGNEWYEAQVRAVVDELGLGDAVTFEGPVRPVTAAYHASTVVVLSSISEGLPYTVMEAMMCRRATVSSDVGGVSEVAGDAGLVVPPRDPRAFADACLRLLDDAAGRDRLATAARERALALFQLERMLSTFSGLYAEVLGAVSAPPVAPVRLPVEARPAEPAPLAEAS